MDGSETDGPLITDEGLDALLTYVDEIVVCCDDTGVIRHVNESFRTLLGYAPEYVVGQNVVDFIHPDEIVRIIEGIERWVGRTGQPLGETLRIRSAEGSWLPCRYDVVFGEGYGLIGSMIVTARLETTVDHVTSQLRDRVLNDDRIIRMSTLFLDLATEDFGRGVQLTVDELASLTNVTRVSVWWATGDRLERRASWEAAAGQPLLPLPERLRISDLTILQRAADGRHTMLSAPWESDPELAAEHELFTGSGVTSIVLEPMIAAGAFTGVILLETTLDDHFGPVQQAAARSAAAILAEVHRRNEVERRLERQARVDQVTGLANRWVYNHEIEGVLADLAAGRIFGVGLALIDIDRFKAVNDTFGHQAGDALLIQLAERLRNAAPEDVLIARMGGDELLALLPGVPTADETLAIVEQLLGVFDRPFHLPTATIGATASAGVAHVDSAGVTPSELLSLADGALYRVKGIGGDGVELADPERHRLRSTQQRRTNELRTAIVEGALDVHYQPEYDLGTGDLIAAEALVRWQHPTEGLLGAGEFVPIAESTGMIIELGHLVLREACRVAASWRGPTGRRPLIRVNVAARQLHQDDFVTLVADALDDVDLPPSSLCIELTESTLLIDPELAASRFAEVRELGVGLAIDDFGTGYSSFLQLRSLPITALKIDRAFVTDLPVSDTDRAIVSATMDLARALGLEVTAEGVETHAQLAALTALGCHSAQGYLLGHPMPAGAFAEVLEAGGSSEITKS